MILFSDQAARLGKSRMATEYYVRQGESVVGPLGSADIKRMFKSREITGETLIRKGETGEWVLVKTVIRRVPAKAKAAPRIRPPVEIDWREYEKARIAASTKEERRPRRSRFRFDRVTVGVAAAIIGIITIGLVVALGGKKESTGTSLLKPTNNAGHIDQPAVKPQIRVEVIEQPIPTAGDVETKLISSLNAAEQSGKLTTLLELAQQIETARSDDPAVHLHASLAYLKAGSPDLAIRVASRYLSPGATAPLFPGAKPPGTSLDLTPEAEGRLYGILGAAHLSKGRYLFARDFFQEAAKRDGTWKRYEVAAQWILDVLTPSPGALALGKEVIVGDPSLPRSVLDLNVEGVVTLNFPWMYEEVRGRLISLLADHSILIEYRPHSDVPSKVIRFPFNSIWTVHRGNESECSRFGEIGFSGWEVAPEIRGLESVSLMGSLFDAKGNLWKGAGRKVPKTAFDVFLQKYTGGYSGFISTEGGRSTSEDLTRRWSAKLDVRFERLPYTWTRGWAKKMRDSENSGGINQAFAAATFLNLPNGANNPYKAAKPDALTDEIIGLLSFAHSVQAATQNANDRSRLSTRSNETNALIELYQIYSRMDETQQSRFLHGGVRVAQVTAMLVDAIRRTPIRPGLAETARRQPARLDANRKIELLITVVDANNRPRPNITLFLHEGEGLQTIGPGNLYTVQCKTNLQGQIRREYLGPIHVQIRTDANQEKSAWSRSVDCSMKLTFPAP